MKWLFAGSVAAAAVLGQPLKFETGPAAPEAGTGRHVHAIVERLKAGEAMGESGSGLVVRGLLLADASPVTAYSGSAAMIRRRLSKRDGSPNGARRGCRLGECGGALSA